MTAPPGLYLTRRRVVVSSLISLLTIGGCAALFAYGFTLARILLDLAHANHEYGVLLMVTVAMLVVPLTIAVLMILDADDDAQLSLAYCVAAVQVVLGALIFLGVLSENWMWYATGILACLTGIVT